MVQERVFVGRRAELDVLADAIDDLRLGRGALIAIIGEPGVGKSTLAAEACALAKRAGVRVSWGRCWEAGGAPACWPFVEVVRELLVEPAARDAVAVLGPRRRALASLAPDALPEVEPMEPDRGGGGFAMYDAVSSFLASMADATPSVIVLDDLHAADRGTVELLELLARRLPSHPLLVLGTWRRHDERNAKLADRLATIARAARVLSLEPLAEDDARALVRATVRDASPEAVEEVVRSGGGNPLFVTELARAGAGGEVPLGITEAIDAHLRVLSPEAREVCELAAVFGRVVARGALLAACAEELGVEEVRVAGHVDEALGHEVLVVDRDVLSFPHILVRDALYTAMSTARRARAHACAVPVLETAGAPPSELAHHALLAVPVVSAADAAARALAAATAAFRAHAYEEAAAILSRALDVLASARAPVDREAIEARLLLAEAEIAAGRVSAGKEQCERAAQLAEQLGVVDLVARAALVHGIELSMGRSDDRMLRLLERALELLDPEPSALRARVLARYSTALMPAPDPEHPIGIAREAVRMAREIEDPKTLLGVLEGTHLTLTFVDSGVEQVARTAEWVRLAFRHGHERQQLYALAMHYFAQHTVGDVRGAEATLARVEQVAACFAQPQQLFRFLLMRAMGEARTGRFSEAERLIAEAQSMASRGPMVSALAIFMMSRMGLARMRRDRVLIASELDRWTAELKRYPHGFALLAWMHAFVGEHEAARAWLARRPFTLRSRPWSIQGLVAEAAVALGDDATCEELYPLLAERTGDVVLWGGMGMTIEGVLDRTLGTVAWQLGRREEAERHFARALELDEASGARPAVGHTLYDWGARVASLDAERGHALLERAAIVYEAMGLDRLAAEARAAGGTRTPSVEVGAGGVEVPQIVREGDVYAVRFAERAFRVRDTKGMRYLEHLLGRPGDPVHVLELLAVDGAAPPEARVASDAGPVLDAEARQAYQTRIRDLQQELDRAERDHDRARTERLGAELDALVEQLSAALGRGGRERRSGSTTERARVNVQRRLRAALKSLGKHSPALAAHLERSLRTGTLCAYDPPAVP